MNKYLLGTTALAAVAFAAAPASAADPIRISITGFYSAGISFTEEDVDVFGVDVDGDLQNVHVRQDGEIQFVGETTLDNGLVVGVQVELEAFTTDDQIDEHYVYFEGSFGHLRIGADDHVSEQMHTFVPTATPGGSDTPTYFLFDTTGLFTPNTAGSTFPSSDENKIIYFTPRFNGFQFGVSFAPNGGDAASGGEGGQYGTKLDATGFEESYSFAANYVQEFNSFGVDIGASYQLETIKGSEDNHVFAGHMYFTFGGFTIGGSGKYVDISEIDDALYAFGIGGLYETGPWAISLGMTRTIFDGEEDVPLSYDNTLVDLGVNYTLGPGVSIWTFAQYYEAEANILGFDAYEADGVAVMFGSTLEF